MTDYLVAEIPAPRPFPWVLAAVLALPALAVGWGIGWWLMERIG